MIKNQVLIIQQNEKKGQGQQRLANVLKCLQHMKTHLTQFLWALSLLNQAVPGSCSSGLCVS